MNAPVKLLLDEHIWFKLAALLRSEGYDVVHINEVNISGASDEAVLQYATDNGRVVFSFNSKDFLILAKQWAERDQYHSGIVVSKQIERGELYKRIKEMLSNSLAKDVANSIKFL